MYNNRLWQMVTVVVVLVAVATNGVAAASAPTGPERSVAPSNCPATFQELRAILVSGSSGYQASECSTLGAQLAALTKLDNPRGHWIGPETASAALGQMAAPAPAFGRGPYASLQVASASMRRQNSDAPGR